MSQPMSVALGVLVAPVETWSPERDAPDESFEYIDLSAVDQDRKVIVETREVPCAEAPSRAKQIVVAGDVLVSTVRPNLNGVARVPSEMDGATASTGFCVLRPRPERLDSAYLFHWVRSPRFIAEMVRRATGASYPAVSDRIVLESQLPLPSVPEQRRIAAILDKADALRAKRHAALAQFDALAQSIFFEMFGDPVTNKKGFPIVQMGDVCDVRDGTHDSPQYVSDGGYPLITSKNVTGGVIDLTNVNYISEADYVQINKRSKVDRGDIILPMIGTIGSPVLVDHEPRYAIKNVALIKFTYASPLAVFVRHILSGHYFDHVVSQKNRGGTQKFVSLGDLRAFPLPLPSKEQQQQFAHFVQGVEKLRANSRTALIELNALLASLQHRAFRGEL